ncbi:HAD family hydrolase [Agreia sp. COWG]|uniref:HAD family hydrolase n=1 Tax=Agreia sp. COWG TaxID=2773266 RepID=UPI0019257F68|nr:HAD family hydrolase [Agreia sp. COWG]CAD5990003.1 putative Inorganic diphosphatase [Agreia sp. COWG]
MALPAQASGLDDLFDFYLRGYRSAWRPFPDSVELVRQVRASGFRVGLLTNGSEAQQLDKLKETGLLDWFDAVCISEKLGVQKPDPAAFHALAAGLGIDAAECLFVGDNLEHDIGGARGVGMTAVHVDRYGAHRGGIADVVMALLR